MSTGLERQAQLDHFENASRRGPAPCLDSAKRNIASDDMGLHAFFLAVLPSRTFPAILCPIVRSEVEMKRLQFFFLMLGIFPSCNHPEKQQPPPKSSTRSTSKSPAQKSYKIEPKQTAAPTEKFPEFANTTWRGRNFEGEQYEVTIHVEGHVAKGFTVKTPTRTVEGYGFYFVGKPELHERLGITSYKFNLEFLMNDARLSGEIFGDKIVFKDVAPLVVAIDYKALFGDSYKGRQSIVEMFDFDGKAVSAFVVFAANSGKARETFEDGIMYEHNERPPIKGPNGLGEASYYKDVIAPNIASEIHFVRKNVVFYFPNHSVMTTPEIKERIYKSVYMLDAAIRDENPAVTIIRMPKILQKVSASP